MELAELRKGTVPQFAAGWWQGVAAEESCGVLTVKALDVLGEGSGRLLPQ